MRFLYLAFALIGVLSPAYAAPDFASAVEKDYDAHLASLFDWFHRNPELSLKEKKTAKRIAQELRIAGAEVTEGVGGTGVVGVMKNGAGPTVLIRADMDGLPIKEDSGLPNMSTVHQVDDDGVNQPVMHACGHDVHITSLIGTARQLAAMKDRWRGAVVFIAQPAEERLMGARAMLNDGLYTRFPKPDYAIGFHVGAGVPTGKMVVKPGIRHSTVDTVDIIVHGVGTHGAAPNRGKDPIVMGAEIVMALQTVVTRDVDPLKPAVITVGAFNGGSKHNVISDEARLLLTVRADDNETRNTLLEGIKRVAANVGRMNGMPEDQLPEVIVRDEGTSVTINDPALTKRLYAVYEREFGEDVFYPEYRVGMGGEDFAMYVKPQTDVPGFYIRIGGTPQADIDAAKAGGPPIAPHHSPKFKIDPQGAVPLGVEAMVVAALDLLDAN